MNFLAAFSSRITRENLERRVALCRVVFALLLFHRYFAISGFALLQNNPFSSFLVCLTLEVLSLFVLFGFLTPIALVALGYFLVFPRFAANLADQVVIINIWGLVLLGAGRTFSLDSYLTKHSRWKKFIEPVYGLSRVCSLAQVRFLLILAFWGVCFSAISYHFYDPLWLKGQVLQLMLDTPYLSQYYWVVHKARLQFPGLYHATCTLGLIVQGAWELLLFPLFFFRAGRAFVIIQGILFFIFSILLFQLQYLPLQELVWWGLALAYSGGAEERRANWNFVFSTGTVAIGLFVIFSLVSAFVPSLQDSPPKIAFKVARAFGQYPVSVFNREDLQMGANYFVLAELDNSDIPRRVVPANDIEGGRLDYLRNDLFYFSYSLPWARQTVKNRFLSDGTPSPFTEDLIQRMVRLDSCIRGYVNRTRYAAYFFNREIHDGASFPSWTESSFAGSRDFSTEVPDGSWFCRHAFALPPGHLNSLGREEATLEVIQKLGNKPIFDRKKTL